jgi:hypothetical protein
MRNACQAQSARSKTHEEQLRDMRLRHPPAAVPLPLEVAENAGQ